MLNMAIRIRYTLSLMIVCILGVILTQGYWLYKDYTYFRDQPLFSADYNFFFKNGISLRAMPLNTASVATESVAALPAIVGYTTERYPAGFSPVSGLVNADTTAFARTSPAIATTLPAIVAYPSQTRLYATRAPAQLESVMMAEMSPVAATVPALPLVSTGAMPQFIPRTMAAVDAIQLDTAAMYPLQQTAQLAMPTVYQSSTYKAPVTYVLQKMKLQFGVSILLIFFTGSCFIFIFFTIFKQRKMAIAKNDFINQMAHELKTPLATVSVAIEAMKKYGALEDRKRAQLYLDISKNEMDHLSSLIELILEQSVFESESMEINAQPIAINQIVTEVVVKYTLANPDLSIQLNTDQEQQLLNADPTHLANVLRNLIDNAIKYTEGKVLIAIESKFLAQHWKLTISDNGMGIPEIYQHDIFEKFFRIPQQQPQVKGFGLGLYYVKQVIEQHHGSISLASKVNQGSVFTILIPFK